MWVSLSWIVCAVYMWVCVLFYCDRIAMFYSVIKHSQCLPRKLWYSFKRSSKLLYAKEGRFGWKFNFCLYYEIIMVASWLTKHTDSGAAPKFYICLFMKLAFHKEKYSVINQSKCCIHYYSTLMHEIYRFSWNNIPKVT